MISSMIKKTKVLILLLFFMGVFYTASVSGQTPSHNIYLPTIVKPANPDWPTANCQPSDGSGGLEPGIYDTTVAGLQAIVVVGTGYDPQKPTYLSYYLHGDGGYDHDWFQFADYPVTEFINENGMILVSPLSPDEGHKWHMEPDTNLEFFTAVLEEMTDTYNVCQNVFLGSSASGGSWFWPSTFFPERAASYPTYMNLSCGAAPWVSGGEEALANLAAQPHVQQYTKIKYTYGSKDFLYDDIQESIRIYTDAGFDVIVDEFPNVEHCAYDTGQETRDFFNSLLPLLYTNR